MDVAGDVAKGIFVQGIPGVTQIDGDPLEPSLLRGSRGPFSRGGGAELVVRGWGGEGCGRADRRQRWREGHSRSLKTSHQHSFKKKIW